MGNKWSKKEIMLLGQNFPLRGARRTKEILEEHGYERSIKAIMQKAVRLMIYRDPPEGYVSVSECGSTHGEGYYRMLFYALRDGVLLDTKANRARYYVPEEWALKMFKKRDKTSSVDSQHQRFTHAI